MQTLDKYDIPLWKPALESLNAGNEKRKRKKEKTRVPYG
jgi:hypothetical protein